jgi:secondary thiamine-phosphate synthase enzyme
MASARAGQEKQDATGTSAKHRFEIATETLGHTQIVDVTPQLEAELGRISIEPGVVHLFVVGSTAALTTVEYEPGLVDHDLKAAFERIAPREARYEHEATWNDDNGHSHVRATLVGPSLTIPFDADGKLLCGTWQQVVLIDFDTRPRRRRVIATIL